ncbi:MAG: XRE family transcriptional regulator [Oscillospiraceae bacterium]|nr:XRE family transcriptional regulator [Oscillospiraceae bacterium]
MDKKIEIGNRIEKSRKALGMTQEELANTLGLNKSTIQRYESGKIEKIKLPIIEAMANALGVCPEYLAAKSDTSENNIEVLPNSKIHMIPVFETVSAGFGAYANDCIIDYMPLYIANISDVPNMMCIKVTGDSMYPKIEDGDIIVVRRQLCVDNGQIAVVLIDGEEGVVKKINAGKDFVELISINPMYPPRRFEDEDTERISIVGLVKQIIKNV